MIPPEALEALVCHWQNRAAQESAPCSNEHPLLAAAADVLKLLSALKRQVKPKPFMVTIHDDAGLLHKVGPVWINVPAAPARCSPLEALAYVERAAATSIVNDLTCDLDHNASRAHA